MIKNKAIIEDNHFLISPELLLLLEWFVAHRAEALKTLVESAYRNGLKKEIAAHESTYENNIALQQSVVDFFSLLEELLHEVTHDQQAYTDLTVHEYYPRVLSSVQLDALFKHESVDKQKLFYKKNAQKP